MSSAMKYAAVALMSLSVGIFGTALYAQGQATSGQPTPKITRNVILDVPLKGIKGFEGVMYITDIPPGMSSPWHYHPGVEFNYILKGRVSYHPRGEKIFTLKPGEGTYNPMGHIHRVWNPSKTVPAELVAVLIKEKGKPLAIAVK